MLVKQRWRDQACLMMCRHVAGLTMWAQQKRDYCRRSLKVSNMMRMEESEASEGRSCSPSTTLSRGLSMVAGFLSTLVTAPLIGFNIYMNAMREQYQLPLTQGEWNHRQFSVCYCTSKHGALTQCCFSVGPPSKTVTQHWNGIGWLPRVCWAATVFWLCSDMWTLQWWTSLTIPATQIIFIRKTEGSHILSEMRWSISFIGLKNSMQCIYSQNTEHKFSMDIYSQSPPIMFWTG